MRTFRRAIAVAAGALSIGLAATACSPSNPDSQAGGGSGGAADRITIGTTADVLNYNPLVGNSRTDTWVTNLMYPRMMSMGMDGVRSPYLASKWEYLDGGRKAKFTLRDDFTWSDGEKVTADDVAFTIDAVAKEKIGVVAGLISSYQKSTVISPTEIEFQLSQPDGTFLENVGFWMPVVPEHVFSKVGSVQKFANDKDWVSAGPYKLTTVERGQRYVLERMENFPLVEGGPKTKEVVFRVFPDVNTEALALRNGDVDLIANALPPPLAKTLEGDSKLKLVKVPSLGWAHMQYNTARKPLDKLEVRQALAAAVDYEAIRRVALQGKAVSSNSSVLTPTLKQWQDPSAKEYAHDPAKAKSLLTGAGFKDGNGDGLFDGLSLRMIYDQADPNISKWAQLVRDSGKEAGIEIKLEGLERNTYVEKYTARDYDIYAGSWAIMENPPANLALAFKCKGFINYANACDPELDALIDQARGQLDQAGQKGPIQQAAKIITDKVYDNVLYVEEFTIAHSAEWSNFLVQPSELLSIVNPVSVAQATKG
ncbi:ABC transporter substrate-binding protein [Plantactinospora endophytica]|uniref:Peptide ABC transporter substrate-binding protein n=1 Tax=Plantactinospora endophytica TaxID=673535 RepID=A0ABQ4DT47_9ACTN|nr:ABC transporter substrate-binding protein [Plantactinospora endophytica]GIG85627.1 peptide ABC transporter substrate-binding protein [Plantactinospora endophytica]